MKHFR